MKIFKKMKVISIICSILGLVFSSFGLLVGLISIGAEGLGQLGVIFIMPSIIALSLILIDFLITIDKIKRGLIYSCIISLIKISIIVLIIPATIDEYKYEMQYGFSNFSFDLILIALLVVVTIPSILNALKFISLRKNNK